MDTSNDFASPLAEEKGPPVAPSTPPVPVETATDEKPSTSTLENISAGAADVGKGLLRAAEGAGRETASTAKALGVQLLPPFARPEPKPEEPTQFITPEPETAVGKVVSGLSQAVLSYGTGAGVLKLGGAAIKGLTGQVVKSGVGAAIAGDTQNPRLSNLLLEHPWLGPIASVIAQNPNDNALVAKAKAMAEDVVTNVVAGQLVKGLRLGYLQLKGKGTTPEAAALEKEVIADSASARPQTSPSGSVADENPLKLSNPKFTPDSQVTGYKQTKLSDIKVVDSMHPDAVNPDKVAALKAEIQAGKMDRLPPVELRVDPNGGYFITDGRHRLQAAQELGYTSITSRVSPAAKPIVLQSPEGEPLVTLTPRKQAMFEQKMEDLVIRDHIEGTPKPEAGPMSKEGSMNTAHMEGPNVVLQGLKDLGQMTKTELGSKMPKERTWAETERLAGILGNKPDELIASLKTFNNSAEDIDVIALGARNYIQTKGAEMVAYARKSYISGDKDAADQFEKIYTDLAEVQAHLASATNRLGRGLSSFNIGAKPFDPASVKKMLSDPVEAEKMQRLIAATDGDPDKIAHILKMQQMSFLEKAVGTHNEYWTGLGLLSRAATQTINLGSTGIQAVMEPFSMIVGGVEQGLAGKGWEAAREGVGIYSGMRSAFFDSLHMAWQAAKTERAIISQNGTMEQKTQFISSLTYNMNPDSFAGKFIDLMGQVTRASFRGLTAGDEFFKQLSYRAKVSATASREAVDLVREGKLTQKDIAGYVAQKLQESIDDAGRATNPEALKYAEKASFVNDLKGATWGDYTSIGELMARAASHPVVRGVILPFVKTPTNVTRTTFEYTPIIGQLRKQFIADVAAGGEKQAQAIGKLTIGSGMYAAAGYLAVEGRITGAPPAPGVLTPPGWQPYSIVFKGMGKDGGDLYLSYQRMQPFGDVLGLTADFAKSTGMLDDDTRQGLAHSMALALTKFMDSPWDTGSNAAVAVGASYGKSLISKSYFRNMTEFFSTFSGYNNEKAALRWFQNYAASHVPGALAQFNSDDTVREVRSTLDAIMARTPGLSQQLPAKRDYFGRVSDVKVGYPWSIIQPLTLKETKGDPVMQELVRLSQSNGKTQFNEIPHVITVAHGPEGQATQMDLKTIKNSAGVTAYDRMNELMQTVKPAGRSRTFHDQLDHVMHLPRYQLNNSLADHLDGGPDTPGLRQNLIKVEEGAYRTAALDQVKNEFKNELHIESARKDRVNMQVGRKKIAVGVYDKLLEMNQ